MSDRPLTPKRERFCHEYVIDGNATQAAIRAGYSKRTARSIGHELLTKPDIDRRIAELLRELTARSDRTADDVLARLWEMAEANIVDLLERGPDGELRPRDPDALPPELQRTGTV